LVNSTIDASSVQELIKGLGTVYHSFSDGDIMFEDGATVETKASF
jgi:hypothetical protein